MGISVMRTVSVGLAALLCLSLVTLAKAERHMFIVANDADGYGIDRCLAFGEECGAAAANAHCKTQAFIEASTYHKVDRSDIPVASLSGIPNSCHDNGCNAVAIVCTR
jgi:hypothetical protein